MDLLNRTDPSSVNLDEAKAEQILSLTNNMLLLICSQTPIIKKLIKSCQSLIISTLFTDTTASSLLHITMLNMCLQIPVRCVWIHTRRTQS